jgi:hypothetical protein
MGMDTKEILNRIISNILKDAQTSQSDYAAAIWGFNLTILSSITFSSDDPDSCLVCLLYYSSRTRQAAVARARW